MAADLLREQLPAHLSVGVTRDGRVFFIDDRIQTTSWLHPRTGLPVKTGHKPILGTNGWEQAVTPEGALYYIDHNTQTTTFEHPVTRRPANHAPFKTSASSPPRSPISPTTPQPNRKPTTPTKARSLKAPPAKREETNMVSMKGWLYRQESGFKSWKKRWCILADFGIFFYKDDEEKNQIGSILLPSYKISQCLPGECSKKFAFKAEHSNMKTYIFASDNHEDMNRWINALKSAAMLKGPSSPIKEPNNNTPQKLVPKSAFMEWDEDEDSPQNRKFWSEGPDMGSPNPRKQQSPDSRSPDSRTNHSPRGPRGPPDNPSFRNDRRSPGSPISKPKIPLDQNMPKGMTYDPFHGYRNDPRNNRIPEPASPRDRYERHRDPRMRDDDPRQRYPSDEGQPFNSRSGIPSDSFNKYASERIPRDSRSRLPEESGRYRSRSSDKYPGGRDSRSHYPDESIQNYGPRDSRSGYSEDSDAQRRSRRRDPTDGLPAIPKENMHNPNRRYRDSDRRHEKQRPKSEHFDQRDHRNLNHDRSPVNDYRTAAYDSQPQDLSPSRYSDAAYDQQHLPGKEDDQGQYDPYHGYRDYNPFHGYRTSPPEDRPKQPEVEYSKIIKVRRNDGHRPDENPYLPMNTSRSGKHPDDYITHDRLQQVMKNDKANSLREGENFGQYSPQRESQQREKLGHRQNGHHSDPGRDLPQETEQKFLYSPSDSNNDEDSYRVNHHQDSLPPHGHYHQGYRDPEDGYSSLTKYKTPNGPQPQEPLRSDIPHYDTNNDLSQHTYENITNTRRDVMDPRDDTPNRPPLPTAVRQQIVEEIAQAKTPHTSQEILAAERNLELRMQQPAFFDYPTPTLPSNPIHQNPLIDPRYGHQTESVPKQHHHRDNYHDNQSYNPGRSRYPDGLPTRGQVEEDLRLLGRHGDPYLRQNGKSTKQHPPGKVVAQSNDLDPDSTKVTSTDHTDKSVDSSRNVQSPDSGILHPLESDLARRRLSPQKNSPEQQRRRSQDEDSREDNSNTLLSQLSALNLSKGANYVNINAVTTEDDVEMERPSAFRPLSSNQNAFPRIGRSEEGEERSRTSYSDRDIQDVDETDIKKRISVASSNLSEQNQPNYNKLTGAPMHQGGKHHGGKQPPKSLPLISTVKEDPDMPDSDIIETREIPDLNQKYPALSGTRLRMSISAADLIGKTHDELVLLLIQLRREFSQLEKVKNYYRGEMERRRPTEIAFRKMQQESHKPIDPRLESEHREYMEVKHQAEEVEKKVEVYRPIVNLVHNMVNMGSLYGGDNFALATQYRKHLLSPEQYSPPKKMIEFSRKQQEQKIVHEMREEVDQLRHDQVDLEEKLERLYELDRILQDQSFKVTALQEDKDLLEKALQGILRQQDQYRDSPHEVDHLIRQQRTIEKELSRVLHQLAQASRELEETTAENNKIEHEVALLRSKVHGELARSKSAPSLSDENMRKKMVMEKDLAKVKNIMAGLTQEGQRLSEAINTLRRSSSGGALNLLSSEEKPRKKEKTGGTYMETDLDTTESKDLSQVKAILSQRSLTSVPDDMNINVETAIQPQFSEQIESQVSQPLESLGFNQPEQPWDISDADENTKRFFGILPKEKPKTLTVRDVKRQSEQRRERDKLRKEIDDMDSEDPTWDSSVSSPKQDSNPIYENLPPAVSQQKPWSSIIPSVSSNLSTAPSRRTSSVHLMGPRPFVKTNTENSVPKPFSLSSGFSFNDSGVVKATRVIVQPNDSNNSTSPLSPSRSQPIVKGWSPVKTNLFNVKRTPKGRYMTISSSEPVKMETSLIQPASLHSVAGDLMTNNQLDMVPDIVKSSTTKVDQMDDATLEREILAFPEKVLIPERYMPESDEEDITEEEKHKRQEKSEKLKKILTSQSIHSLSQPDVSNVAQEKVRRAQLLSMNQELARQVTKKSREAAAARRKTWSGSPGKIIVPDPEEEEVVKETDMSKYQRQENLYI